MAKGLPYQHYRQGTVFLGEKKQHLFGTTLAVFRTHNQLIFVLKNRFIIGVLELNLQTRFADPDSVESV